MATRIRGFAASGKLDDKPACFEENFRGCNVSSLQHVLDPLKKTLHQYFDEIVELSREQLEQLLVRISTRPGPALPWTTSDQFDPDTTPLVSSFISTAQII